MICNTRQLYPWYPCPLCTRKQILQGLLNRCPRPRQPLSCQQCIRNTFLSALSQTRGFIHMSRQIVTNTGCHKGLAYNKCDKSYKEKWWTTCIKYLTTTSKWLHILDLISPLITTSTSSLYDLQIDHKNLLFRNMCVLPGLKKFLLFTAVILEARLVLLESQKVFPRLIPGLKTVNSQCSFQFCDVTAKGVNINNQQSLLDSSLNFQGLCKGQSNYRTRSSSNILRSRFSVQKNCSKANFTITVKNYLSLNH